MCCTILRNALLAFSYIYAIIFTWLLWLWGRPHARSCHPWSIDGNEAVVYDNTYNDTDDTEDDDTDDDTEDDVTLKMTLMMMMMVTCCHRSSGWTKKEQSPAYFTFGLEKQRIAINIIIAHSWYLQFAGLSQISRSFFHRFLYYYVEFCRDSLLRTF